MLIPIPIGIALTNPIRHDSISLKHLHGSIIQTTVMNSPELPDIGLFPSHAPYLPTPGKPAIAVLMSGGVDSSVTARLLQQAGWDLVGVTMRIPTMVACPWERTCCGGEAAVVCQQLGIPHYFAETEDLFKARIIEPFRQAYVQGDTPSPCVDCNTTLKFGILWDLIQERLGIQHIATGHYAHIETREGGGEACLRRAADLKRDQSYFLYGIPLDRLPFVHLPLGVYTKAQVRQIAADQQLPVAQKPDSMELCFAAQGDYRHLLSDIPPAPGPIRDIHGAVIGQHAGLHHYTIGQRKGLGIASLDPLYVIDILPRENALIAGSREHAYTRDIHASRLNILQPQTFHPGAIALGKIRSIGNPSPCTLIETAPGKLHVHFDQPQFAPAPGQHLVLYDAQNAIIAGGTIIRPATRD